MTPIAPDASVALSTRTRRRVLLGALLSALALNACAPLVLGGAMVGGTLVAIDRRTPGAQVDDQTIEIKGHLRVNEALNDRGHVTLTSYNRLVLVTGEVSTEAEKTTVTQVVNKLDNVRTVVNELGVMGSSSLSSRSADALLGGRAKAALVEAKDVQSTSIKIVAERGTLYLMGRVTEREATKAAEILRNLSGVQKVVRVFELLSEAELAELLSSGRAK